MRRLVCLTAGGILGAVVFSVIPGSGPGFGGAGVITERFRVGSESGAGAAQGAPPGWEVPTGFTDRVAAYQVAAAADDVVHLESLIRMTAAMPRSAHRDFELEVLLVRLVELDPYRAAESISSLQLTERLLRGVFKAWVEVRPDSVSLGLRAIDDAAAAHSLALTVLAAADMDEAMLDRVALAVPQLRREGLRIDGLARKAEHDWHGALTLAMAIEDRGAQLLTLSGIARASAVADPLAALAQSESIADVELRRSFRRQIKEQWATDDPGGFMQYVAYYTETLDDTDPWNAYGLEPALRIAAEAAPLEFLHVAEGAAGPLRTMLMSVALEALAENDPAQFVADFADAGFMRDAGEAADTYVRAIARGLARRDPELALHWTRSLHPPSDDAHQIVMTLIAQADLPRAIQLELIQLDLNRHAGSALSAPRWLRNALSATRDPDVLARAAQSLAAANLPGAQGMVTAVVNRWVASDPDAAISWVLSHPGARSELIAGLAQEIGRDDMETAMRYASMLPEESRAAWVVAAARSAASRDPLRAAEAIVPFRGEPVHDSALSEIVVRALLGRGDDPPLAARLLEDASAEVLNRTAGVVARRWAEQSPMEAAEWAIRVTAPDARARALRSSLSVWRQSDALGASQWAQSLPDSLIRGEALGYLSDP